MDLTQPTKTRRKVKTPVGRGLMSPELAWWLVNLNDLLEICGEYRDVYFDGVASNQLLNYKV